MDRASVYGTEGDIPQGAESQELTDSADSARSAGRSAQNGNGPLTDPDLAFVVDTWSRMTAEAKAAVLAIVRQAEAGAAQAGQQTPQDGPRGDIDPEAVQGGVRGAGDGTDGDNGTATARDREERR